MDHLFRFFNVLANYETFSWKSFDLNVIVICTMNVSKISHQFFKNLNTTTTIQANYGYAFGIFEK